MAAVPANSRRGGSAKSLESVDRVVRVLRAFEPKRSFTLAEIARRTDLNEATALRYLGSLVAHGVVERTESNQYRPGWELFRLGQLALTNRVPREAVLPVMEELRDRFHESVNLATREGDDLVIVEVLPSTRTVKQLNEVGQHDPWHASALGKAMLAAMSAEERGALLDRAGCPKLTKNTIVDRKKLDDELEATRERGYAIDAGEVEEDLTCVAASISDSNGVPFYGLSVSFLTHRLEPDTIKPAGAAVNKAANDVRERLSYVPRGS